MKNDDIFKVEKFEDTNGTTHSIFAVIEDDAKKYYLTLDGVFEKATNNKYIKSSDEINKEYSLLFNYNNPKKGDLL